jgi:hypothetical protein
VWGFGGVGVLSRLVVVGSGRIALRIGLIRTNRVDQAELDRLLPGNRREPGLWRFEAGEQHQVVGDDGGPDVGLEVVEPAPGATCETIAAVEAGEASLDPGAEVAQPAIDPGALDHVGNGDAALLVEGDILHAARLWPV